MKAFAPLHMQNHNGRNSQDGDRAHSRRATPNPGPCSRVLLSVVSEAGETERVDGVDMATQWGGLGGGRMTSSKHMGQEKVCHGPPSA
ncbi:unnamed protein product [Merluccius merluccius]